MKLTRKSIGRIAATFVATAMLATLAIVPASAEENPPAGVTKNPVDNQFTVNKVLTVQENSFTPNTTFTFDVSNEGVVLSREEQAAGIEVGPAGGVTMVSGAVFTPTDDASSGTVTKQAKFQVNLQDEEGTPIFTHAGIYKYSVSEVDAGYDGIQYDDAAKALYVYVTNDGNNLKVSYTELKDANGETKSNAFNNNYGDTDDNDKVLNDLVVYKTITGDYANMSETFGFTVKVEGETGEQFKAVVGTYANGVFNATPNVDPIPLTSGTPSEEIQLGQNGAIKIYGLDDNDKYTITENGANTDGYSLTIDGTSDDDGVTSNTISEDTVVNYTNTRNGNPPTGIMMDIAPYALLVIVAGAACFIFLRKRNKD